jgi:Fe-S cluster assembly protein SufD
MSQSVSSLPSNRDENWKYASLRALSNARFDALPTPDEGAIARAATLLTPRPDGFVRLVLVDGCFAPSLSDPLPRGAVRSNPSRIETPDDVDHLFATLNARHAREALHVTTDREAALQLEIWCITVSAQTDGAAHPLLRIEVGAGGQLDLVERHASAPDTPTLTNLALYLTLARDAQARIVRTQACDLRAQHQETLQIDLQSGTRCELVQITDGAAHARTTAFVRHSGRESRLRWASAALGRGTQVQDAYVHVDHAAPGARTEQFFRGIANDRARVAFNGHMKVARGATDCNSDQSLKCVLAGNDAEADVRPQLEIHTDAVQASHGATVGKLDDTMKFYLLSRGLDPEVAENLLKWAFIADVIARIPLPQIRTQLAREVASRMPGAPPFGVES